MVRKKKETGVFAQINVQAPDRAADAAGNENETTGGSWRFIRITYPNGVSITVPSGLDTGTLSRYIYLK